MSATSSSPPPYVSLMHLLALHTGSSKWDGYDTVDQILEFVVEGMEDHRLSSEQQQRLHAFVSRLANTWEPRDTHRQALSLRLTCWVARQRLHLIAAHDRAAAESCLTAAEAWCDGKVEPDWACPEAIHPLIDAADPNGTDALWAERAVAWVVDASLGGTRKVHSRVYSSAPYVVIAVVHYDYADEPDDVVADRLVAFLTGLLDEHDRLTGRTPVDLLTPSEVAALRMLAALT